MNEKTMTMRVTRFMPGQNGKPTTQDYEIPFREDWVVLDALNHIKDRMDGTLSYRWSCRMGVCGSCGMMVNGEAKLTCSAFLRDYYPKTVTVEPLANFPIIRDLVVDMSDFMDKLKSVKPWIIREKEMPLSQGEYRQSPAQLASFRQFSLCINCMLCYSACPIFGQETDFIGPAAIALAHRYNEDSRDEGNDKRRDVINGKDGAWECTFVGECSIVCPKHVDPAAAIQRVKMDNAKDWIKSMILPRGQA